MSSYPPPFPTYPILTPQTFNNDFFTNTGEGLSLDNAYKYFLRLTGGTISGNLNVLLDFNNSGNTYLNTLYIDNILVNSTATEINYLHGITLGVGSPSKVLTLNASSNVSGINTLTTKTLDVDSTNNTAISLSGGSENYALHLHTNTNGTGTSYGSAISFNYNAGTNQVPLSAIALDRIDNKTGDLVFYNRNNINDIQENFRMRSTGEFKCVSLNINNVALTASATELNYLDFSPSYTLGVNEASKAVVLDSSRNTSNINNLTLTNLIGSNISLSSANLNNFNTSSTNATVITASSFTNQYDMYFRKPSTTAGQTLGIGFHITTNDVATSASGGSIIFTRVSAGTGNLSFNTSGGERLRISDTGIVSIYNTTNSTTPTTGALVLSGGLGVGGHVRLANNGRVWINSEFGFSHAYSTGGTAEVITYNNGTTGSYIGTYTSHNFGVATAGVIRIGVDTSGNVNIVNHNGSTTGLRLNNTLITATATELNYLDFSGSYVLGVCEASKAVVLDSSRNCSNINSITSDFLVVNTAINSSNASANFRKLTLQSLANNFGVISVQGGNNSSPFFGSTDSILYCESSNLSPICFELNVSNLTSATSTNSLRFGTTTANDLNLFTNQIERLNIASTGAVKVLSTTQTSSPTTGALLVDGGIGCNKAIWANNNIISNGRLKTLNAGIGLEHTDNTIGLISYVNIADLVFNQGAYFGTNTNHNLIFQTNQLERMRINAGGNVSIGNTNNTYALDITGDVNCSGSFRVNGTALPTTGDLSKISGITNGVVSANKAVVVDGNKDITGFNRITTAELVVSDMIADGTTNIGVDGNMIVDGDLTLDVGNLTVKRNILGTAGNCTIERNFTCNNEFRLKPDGFTLEWGSSVRTLTPPFHYAIGTINNNGWLLMANDNSNGIWLATSGNIGINTKSPSYQLDVDGSLNITSFYLNGSQVNSTATQLNYLSGTTLGTITASKVITVDSSSNINSTLRLKKTASDQQIYFENGTSTGTVYHTLNGDLNVGTISANDLVFQTNNTNRLTITSAGLMNIQGGWQISGSTVSASATELNYLDFSGGYVLGVNEASKAVVLDSSRNTSNINNITMTGSITMSGINRFLLMRNSGLTNGQNVNFVLGRTSATNEQGEITFTYSTTANASYLSLGHFGSPSILNVFQSGNVSIGNTSNAYKLDINGSLNSTSLYLNGSQILATASELNVLDGYTGTTAELNYLDLSVSIGNGEASKALILDTNKDIVGIRKLGLTGSDDFITLTNNGATTTRTTIRLIGDNTQWEFGSRNSANSGYPNHFYIYGNANFRFVIDTSGNVDIINHNGATVGLKLGGTLITASATELNYVDTTAGSAEANKALILNGTRDISNINILGITETVIASAMRIVRSGGINYFQSGATTTSGSASDFFIGNYLNTITSSARKFMIKSDGKVGIQTEAPAYTLDVSGDINLTGDLRKSGTVCKISALTGITDGIAQANKCLIVDAYKALQGIDLLDTGRHAITYNALHALIIDGTHTDTTFRILNSTAGGKDWWIGGAGTGSSLSAGSFFIYSGSNSAVRLMITNDPKLLYNTSTAYSNARITLNGSVAVAGTSDWVDGSYQITGSFRTSDSANEIQIQQQSGGDAFIGTKSNNRFCFMTNNTRAMNIDTNQRVGIGTSSPSTLLHVDGSVSSTVSTGQHGYLNTGGAGWNLNPITFNNSLRTSSSIYCGGTVYAFSDRRIKKDIEIIPDDYSDKFFEDITLIKHRYNHEEETSNKYLGVIAQEVLKNGYIELIAMHPDEKMKKENDDDIEGFLMNVDYAKIALLCVQQIKKLKKELKEIKDFISTLDIQEV